MSDPTFTDPPSPTPDKTQSNATFSAAVAAFLAWLATFVSEMNASITWMRARVNEVTAGALLSGDLPDMTGQAGNLIGVNAAEDAVTFFPQVNPKNLIVDGSGRINQTGYVSGTATSGGGEYTLDMWRVVVLGQSLTFTGTPAGRVMTAPAGGVEQVLDADEITGGTYVIDWKGTATATVEGVSVSKGDTLTLTAATAATVRFTGGTFSEAQIELGSIPSKFERITYGEEFLRVARHFERTFIYMRVDHLNYSMGTVICYKNTKRAVPLVTLNAILIGDTNLASVTVVSVYLEGCSIDVSKLSPGTGGNVVISRGYDIDARAY